MERIIRLRMKAADLLHNAVVRVLLLCPVDIFRLPVTAFLALC